MFFCNVAVVTVVVTVSFLATVDERFLKFMALRLFFVVSSQSKGLIFTAGRSMINFLSYFSRDTSLRFHYLPVTRVGIGPVVL
jgi:hypothetical protein